MPHNNLPYFNSFRITLPVNILGLFHGQNFLAGLVLPHQKPPMINASQVICFQGHEGKEPHFLGAAEEVESFARRPADY